MAEYKKMKLEDVFADIEKIMGADASDEEKSMQLRKKSRNPTGIWYWNWSAIRIF